MQGKEQLKKEDTLEPSWKVEQRREFRLLKIFTRQQAYFLNQRHEEKKPYFHANGKKAFKTESRSMSESSSENVN